MLNSFNVGKPNPLFIFFISIFSFAHEVSEGNRVCPKEGREECLETRKTLGVPENTGFLGSVVANWLQKCVIRMI